MIDNHSNIFLYIKKLYDEKTALKYLDYIKIKPVQYIRVNTLKTSKDSLSKTLYHDYGIESESFNSIPGCLKIIRNGELTGKTVQHINGDYYMQSLSSMLPPVVLNPSQNDVVLDLCAAPGSKTTQLAAIMNNKGTLIANEIALNRIKMLVFNIDRLNIANAGVVHSKGELLGKIYSDHFDKILVDAPCSGLGIIQKKNEVSDWWSLNRTSVLSDLQLRLLISAIKMVKPGGEILYSTCTLTIEENELIIDKVLNKYPVEIIDIELPVKSHPAFSGKLENGVNIHPSISKAHRILPWEVNSEGFFIVKMRKTGSTVSPQYVRPKGRELNILDFNKKEVQKFLRNIIDDFNIDEEILSGFSYLIKGNDIFFVNKDWNDENPGMFERIGIRFGNIDKNGNTVLHTNAVQLLQDHIKNNIYEIENSDQLKTYLEGGILKKDISRHGQCAIKYRNSIIGTAVVTNSGIKSRFPRSKRTQEILIEGL